MNTALAAPPTWADVAHARERIAGAAHRTPVLTSRTLDTRTGVRAFLKGEHLQRIGAFKFRGGFNAIAALSPEVRARGVVAFSSGNHAQAIALAAQQHGIPATIVMPTNSPRTKREATAGYGARVVLYDPTTESRETIGAAIAAESGATLIPPFDHPDVIAGQGTTAAELIEDVGPLDWLLVCCGGGGLLSGCALAAAQLSPGCKVVGVEPEAGDDVTRSFRSGERQFVTLPDTIADGARTPAPGLLTLPIILAHVHDMVTVPDRALIEAARFMALTMKQVIEPTGGLALAALLTGAVRPAPGARVGVVLSGGNVDAAMLRWMLMDDTDRPATPPTT
ncbi:MAG: threo-3-hydroxy-L-aspartate ammonia-lyase [Gemmatimonadaceae bacterium]|jgi:threonine dehydratase|nr:threo-3-hydroxy-L-aspartate ammonia-lyase [Gemmatimonadaceae bacterium]